MSTSTPYDEFYKNHLGDMWFGMKVDASFYQPKNGLEKGNEVKFDFSGDDDVWVFIDGVKVLDIGGIHGEIFGTINFTTGDVVVKPRLTMEAVEEFHVGKKENQLSDEEKNAMNAYLNGIFEEYESGKYRFRDYTSHTMKFFYMERGASRANCSLKFNFPVLPENTVKVQKEIVKLDEYDDVDFVVDGIVNANGDTVTENTTVKHSQSKCPVLIIRCRPDPGYIRM